MIRGPERKPRHPFSQWLSPVPSGGSLDAPRPEGKLKWSIFSSVSNGAFQLAPFQQVEMEVPLRYSDQMLKHQLAPCNVEEQWLFWMMEILIPSQSELSQSMEEAPSCWFYTECFFFFPSFGSWGCMVPSSKRLLKAPFTWGHHL